jgi:N-acetylglucosamine kinase-like BadF-type ATPase
VFDAAFLGITGANGRTEAAVRDCVAARRFRLANDKVNALASVTTGKPGVVVIAGTGTIAYGENSRGETADASGWGFLLGDEGGGFWIARQAIAAACRAHDRRGPETALTGALLRAAGVDDMWDLHALIYSEKLSRADIAALAAVVPRAARDGDTAARRILRQAGSELGLSASVVAQRLRMHRGATAVGMVGGVFRMSDFVRSSFRRKVRGTVPKAVFAGARFTPVIGSVLLALRLADVKLTASVIANLEEASRAIGAK